jgi:hypothetical protein
MDKYLYKAVLIEVWAEGYYSNQSEQHYAFIPIEIYEPHRDAVKEHISYFHDLDGKHSEIQGTVVESYICTPEDLKLAYLSNKGNESWRITEGMDDIFSSDEISAIEDITGSIMMQFTSEVTTIVKFNGEVV